jgi:CubicO group peptidase (beta-lactamase class C family)
MGSPLQSAIRAPHERRKITLKINHRDNNIQGQNLLIYIVRHSLSDFKRYKLSFMLLAGMVLILTAMLGCGPSAAELKAVDYTPLAGNDWQISTAAEQGLDPVRVAKLYYNASKLDTIYSILVIKNGYLVAEKYFNGASIDQLSRRASVTKSYTSAMVGLAMEKGCLTSLDQKMIDFFPDIADQITDPRKKEITIRQMLQMRAGYPWEETDPALWDALWSGAYLDDIVNIPLTSDPGTRFQYSNLTAHWVGIIVARACDTDLKTFGQEHLFSPINAKIGEGWNRDLDGYYIGSGDIMVTARDMAKFGLLYLNDGIYDGKQIVPADWVHDSLQTYTENAWTIRVGPHFKDIGYGYFWWSGRADDHHINFAWGHGGQLIVLVDDLNMVVVVTADPFYGKQEHWNSWEYEKANINLVFDFIASITG